MIVSKFVNIEIFLNRYIIQWGFLAKYLNIYEKKVSYTNYHSKHSNFMSVKKICCQEILNKDKAHE